MSDTASTTGPDMSNAPQPQDRKAPKKTAAQIEAEGDETVEVPYEGEVYTFPADIESADYEVLEALDNQKLSFVIRALLSTEDYAKFKSTKPKFKDAPALFAAYAEEIGMESAGN